MNPTRSLVAAVSASLLLADISFAAEPAKKPAAPAPKPEAAKKAAAAAPPASEPAPPAAPAAAPLPEIVAVVDGAEIKGPELEVTFNGFLASRQIPADQLPAAEKARGYRMILDEMIKEKLISKRAAEVKVTDQEVTDTFKKFTATMGTEEEVKKQIEASGQTLETVRENIRSSLKQEHWLDAEVAKKGGVSDKDAEDFYKSNGDKFVSPAEVRASHILLQVPAEAKPEVVIEKQKAAQAVAARVKKGEDFAKIAKEVSEDVGSKENGGDLDFFKQDQMVPEFANAAFGMKKGDISDPIRSQFGYHVIKVTDRKESSTIALDTVKPKVMTYLKTQKIEALKQEIRDKAAVKINLPEPPPAPAIPEISTIPGSPNPH